MMLLKNLGLITAAIYYWACRGSCQTTKSTPISTLTQDAAKGNASDTAPLFAASAADKVLTAFPDRSFAPYVDITAWPTFDIVGYSKVTGVKRFVLAFVVASGGEPSWGGFYKMQDQYYVHQVQSLRKLDGDVIISFGGATGTEIACMVTTPEELAEKYLSVIRLYKARWADFDIEGYFLKPWDSAAEECTERRNIALRIIRKQLSWPVKISYTLPVTPSGLDDIAVTILQSSIRNGVEVDLVNIMTMNYGPSHAPNGKTGMGGYAISAAGKTREQLQLIGLNAKIGITPMIGQNDVGSEVFRQEDAAAIARWAKGSSYVSFIGMWSANRDNSKFTTDANSTLAASSLVKQEDGEFGRTLLSFET